MKKLIYSLASVLSIFAVSLFGVGNIALAATYTTNDVSSHNTAADCWQVINGNVYNLSSFLTSNPTGPISSTNCGTDVSTGINGGQNPMSTINQLNPYLIGIIGQASNLTTTKVTPSTLSVAVGATKELGVSTLDQNNSPIAGNLTFTSSNPSVATVNNYGLVTGISAGTATITVMGNSLTGNNNASGTATVTVTGTGNNNPILTTVTLSPATPTIAVNGTAQLTANAKDQSGAAFTGATNTYSSSNTSVATVNNNGLITGVAPGTATITVSSVGGSQTVTGTSMVTVQSGSVTPILSSVSLTPTTSTLTNVGGTQTLTAKPLDQNGMAFSGATYSYTSSNPSVATVDAITGTITAVSNGTATITVTATSGSTSVTGTHTVTVNTGGNNNNAPTITSVSMPSGAKVGQLVTATINATDPQNGTLTYSVKWGDENNTLRAAMPFVQTATFTHFYNTAGTYTATFTVKNAAGQIATSTLMITVTANGGSGGNLVLTSVTVTPQTASIAVGGTSQLTATAKDQNGGTFSGATLTYTSSNTGVATVSNSGLVTGVAAGTATITAKAVSGSVTVSGTSMITVTQSGGGNNNLAPVISGISAPTVLGVGEQGTWTVQASDPQNGNLSYSVDWGEAQMMSLRSASTDVFTQTATFTHTYQNTGTYTVKFTVKNSSNMTAVSTVTVNVGTTSNGGSSELGSIALIANDYEVDIGSSIQMDVVYKDQNEDPMDGSGMNATFSSSNPSVATVDSSGVVKGVSQGEATITATVNGITDTALMTVTPGYEGNSGSNNNSSSDRNNNSDSSYVVKGYSSGRGDNQSNRYVSSSRGGNNDGNNSGGGHNNGNHGHHR